MCIAFVHTCIVYSIENKFSEVCLMAKILLSIIRITLVSKLINNLSTIVACVFSVSVCPGGLKMPGLTSL